MPTNSKARQALYGEICAEFLGTMILLLFGDGVVAQVIGAKLGDHTAIAWGWGLGVTFGVYVAGRLTGAHLNPAVTLAFAVFDEFPWRKVIPYWFAQTLGAFVAGLLVRWDYTEVLAQADPHHTFRTQIVFSTLPGNGTFPVSEWGALRDQVIGTAILLLLIFAVVDVLNTPPKANMAPFIIGLIVVAIGLAWGTDAGYAINPARDFGPRLASFLTGYHRAWRDQYGEFYFWVPIIGPLVGGVVGAAIYRVLITPYVTRLGRPEIPPPGRLPEEEE